MSRSSAREQRLRTPCASAANFPCCYASSLLASLGRNRSHLRSIRSHVNTTPALLFSPLEWHCDGLTGIRRAPSCCCRTTCAVCDHALHFTAFGNRRLVGWRTREQH